MFIDLDPKTCLRYCSNITEPGPAVFYLPSDKAETTPLNYERERKIYTQLNKSNQSRNLHGIDWHRGNYPFFLSYTNNSKRSLAEFWCNILR